MKILLIPILCLTFISAACSSAEHGRLEPLEVEETEFGTISTYYQEEDITDIETGPISIEVAKIIVSSADVEKEEAQVLTSDEESEQVAFMLFVSTKDENILFSPDHLTLETSKGEIIQKPDDYLSDTVDIQYLEEREVPRRITYPVQESEAAELNEVSLNIKAPTDLEGNALDEDTTLTIDLTTSP
ncbi:hypothetical protein ATL39_3040 [Sinobaca qinghaiensis]|uniref:Lipoprotein n=2 Tax=Sinobaca qinghaiensis TaxID=342944 RepID=A0A419UWW7_9BACL|nr:hypothetical protein ATL39_3040 [Sinobaca qinghaiensis]